MKLLITLSPRLPAPPSPAPQLLSATLYREDRPFLRYIQHYLDDLSRLYPERTYKVVVTNSSGLQVLLCRYLTSCAPPPPFRSLRSLLHLVSTIPFLPDTQAFIGSMDLWCSTEEFWAMGAGDEEEHAVSLFNYLRYLHIEQEGRQGNEEEVKGGAVGGEREKLFLALGKAIPEGEDAAYLILRDAPFPTTLPPSTSGGGSWWGGSSSPPPATVDYSAKNYLVINPSTGHVYSAVDPYCPLKEIHLLATPFNLYANIQLSASPRELSFDVFNPQNFRPFFNHQRPRPMGGLSSIQSPTLSLRPTEITMAAEIERAVYQAIRNSVRRWRSKSFRAATTFHPEISNVVQDLLPKLEEWKRSGQLEGSNNNNNVTRGSGASITGSGAEALELLEKELESRMKTVLRTRVFRGCPLNLAFTDVDEVLSKVSYSI